MVKIENTQTMYVCDICKRKYYTAEDATKCEQQLASKQYISCSEELPQTQDWKEGDFVIVYDKADEYSDEESKFTIARIVGSSPYNGFHRINPIIKDLKDNTLYSKEIIHMPDHLLKDIIQWYPEFTKYLVAKTL
jgi:hypothetical protein